MRIIVPAIAVLIATGCATSRPEAVVEPEPASAIPDVEIVAEPEPVAPAPPAGTRYEGDYGIVFLGDEVVFEFRPEQYHLMTPGGATQSQPYTGVTPETVTIAGDFNGWDKMKWKMEVVDGVWTYKAPRSSFEATRVYNFKFVVNTNFWMEPPADAKNAATSGFGNTRNMQFQLKAAE